MKIALLLVGALLNSLQSLAQDAPHNPPPALECPVKWPMFFAGFLAGYVVCVLHTFFQDRQHDQRLKRSIDNWDGVSESD